MIEVEGRVCRIRQLSKRLIFYDLLMIDSQPSAGGDAQNGAPAAAASTAAAPPVAAASPPAAAAAATAGPQEERWLEVVAKESKFPDVQLARDAMRIGDIVRFMGEYEDSAQTMLTCLGFQVLVHWKDVSGGRSFQPRPPPTRHTAPRKQQHHEKQQQQKQQREEEGSVPQQQQQLCKFFVNSGKCMKGDACPFVHGDASQRGATLAAWVKRRRAERRANALKEGCVHVAGASSKRHRAWLFAQWLVDKFGKEALNAGAGVLDIAGGRGAMTFELVTNHGIRCTLVEPRPLRLDKLQHRTLKSLSLRAEITRLIPPPEAGGVVAAAAAAAAAAAGGSCRGKGSGADEEEEGAWWREEEEEEEGGGEGTTGAGSESDSGSGEEESDAAAAAAVAGGVEGAPAAQFEWLEAMRRNAAAAASGEEGQSGVQLRPAEQQHTHHQQQHQQQQSDPNHHQQQQQQQRLAKKRIPKADRAPLALRQVQSLFGPALWTADWWAVQGLDCPSLIIGLHPDEATDYIVDFALRCGAPFAVVPCCVFPRKFPHRRRRVAGGENGGSGGSGGGDDAVAAAMAPVVTYPELVEYLVQKGEARGAVEEPLPFVGCNRVVWAPAAGAVER